MGVSAPDVVTQETITCRALHEHVLTLNMLLFCLRFCFLIVLVKLFAVGRATVARKELKQWWCVPHLDEPDSECDEADDDEIVLEDDHERLDAAVHVNRVRRVLLLRRKETRHVHQIHTRTTHICAFTDLKSEVARRQLCTPSIRVR